MRKSKKKNEKTQYFTTAVDDAIIIYNLSEDQEERNLLYNIVIYPAFDKLCENIINTFNFPYIEDTYEDLKGEVVSFLTEKLSKYNTDSGKAYSYYSIVAKNYLIAKNNKGYSKTKARVELDVIDEERDLQAEDYRDHIKEALKNYIDQWVSVVDSKLDTMFSHPDDIIIADSILELFRVRGSLDIFNKKGLYVLIRERTELKTQRITKVITVLKADFYEGYYDYIKV